MQGQSDAGVAEIDGDEAYDESEGGSDFEVDETLDAHAANAFQIAVACDSGDERREDQRRDDGLDEAQEYIAEDTKVDRNRRRVEAQLRTRDHGNKNPGGERAPLPSKDREQPDCGTAQSDSDVRERLRGQS